MKYFIWIFSIGLVLFFKRMKGIYIFFLLIPLLGSTIQHIFKVRFSIFIFIFFQNEHSSNAPKNNSTSSFHQIVNQRSLTLENGITFIKDCFIKICNFPSNLFFFVFLKSSLTFPILVDASVSLHHHISKRGVGVVKASVGVVKLFCFFFCKGNLICL